MFSSSEIKMLRHSRQMKQIEMAKKMGITKQRYSQLENHPDMPSERLEEILAVLGYTVKSARKYLENIPARE